MTKLKYTLAITSAAFFLGGVALSIRSGQSADSNKENSGAAPQKAKSDVLKLDRATQERIGIQVQPLQSATIGPEIRAYGTLEVDPSEQFVLNAPFTGVLESNGEWPALGSAIAEGTDVGHVRPVFTPADQIGLGERLASARAEVDAAKASVTSATKEASRLKSLNANDQNVSDKAVEEAEAQLAAQQARLKSAQASVKLLAAPLQVDSGVGPGPLQVRKSGQITEIAAQPGETVQAGQPLLRVSRFDHLLARLHVPPGQSVPASPSRATIYLADNPDVALAAHRVALAGSIDPKYPGQTWLFRLAPGKAPLRPGQAVTAHIPVTGQRVTGVSIPSSAILRYEGETWVYVERAAGEFVRRVAHLEEPGKEGWIARSGFAPGERIVIAGAQSLLSEQLRYQLESDEE